MLDEIGDPPTPAMPSERETGPVPTAGDPVAPSKSVLAYDRLRAAIISMELPPGAALAEKNLCTAFGVSRTPLREAVLRLQRESLVTAVPGAGTFVDRIVRDEVLQGLFVRQTLELQVVAIAARRFDDAADAIFVALLRDQQAAADSEDVDASFALDNAFHRSICRIAGLPRVWSAIHGTTGQLDRIRRQSFSLPGFHREVVDEHRALHAALAGHDAATAGTLMRIHLDGILHSLEVLCARDPDLFEPDGAAPVAAPAP
jgi:DNA-binding GntR family transcriptional regulator